MTDSEREDYLLDTRDMMGYLLYLSPLKSFKNFKTFDYSEDRMYEVENDLDPEMNFLHTVHNDFKHHTE